MASYRKRKNNNGTFSHQFRIRRYGYPLVTRTFERKTDGEAWVQETESAMRAGKFAVNRYGDGLSVKEVIDFYLQSSSFNRRRSKHSPTQTLNWWKDSLGQFGITKLTKQIVKQQWLKLEQSPSPRIKRNLSNRTINSYLESLSSCLSFAVEEEILDANPILKIKKKSLNNSRERILSENELKMLLDAAGRSSNRYLKTALLVSLSTGGRRSEVLGLTWDDVNLKSGEIRFRVTKNGKPRSVILGRTALLALTEHSKLRSISSSLVFPPLKVRRNGLRHVPWEDLRAPFLRACSDADIRDFRWHDLRHCAASFLIMSGATIEEAMKVLGHRSSAMSWRYSHLDNRRTAELAAKVDNTFLHGAAG